MGGVASVRVGEAALGLVHPGDVVIQLPLWPAPADLGGVEELERDALGREAVGVVGHRDRGVARPEVQAAGDRHDPLVRLGLHDAPRLVGAPGETDVVGAVVGEADDPAVIGGGAADVAELELLKAQDTGVRAPGSASKAAPDPIAPSPTTMASQSRRVVGIAGC